MAILGGFDDDVWFGLQNSQQNHFNNYGFSNTQQIINNNHNNIGFINNYANHNTVNQVVPLSPNLESQLELQRQELEFILHFENEKLRLALHEQRKQQVSSLMKSLEARAKGVMRQKDEDLARATRKGAELEAMLSQAESKSQAWQRIARANEATISDLNNALEQALRERRDFLLQQNDIKNRRNDNAAEDAASSCYGSAEENDNARKWVCKKCNAISSCVVFVPCKHLCSCRSCEASLGSCPVCGSTKEASFEVFLE